LTGKSQGDISKLLSLQRIEPTIQKQAREGNGLSRRHLVAIAQLPHDEQKEVAEAITQRNLSSTETDELVARKKGKRPDAASRCQHRYQTSNATILVTFRKNRVSPEEVLAALREACEKIQAADRHEESAA
jgi:hypothetical protein